LKCRDHPTEDAVAICKICGRGVCDNCLVTIANNSYCKECVEAGRVTAPKAEVPAQAMPTVILSKSLFYVGGAGSILSAIMSLLLLIVSGFLTLWIIGASSYYYSTQYQYLMSVVGVSSIMNIILAIALILAGIGYLGMRRNYGSGTGAAGFAFSIVACVFLFLTAAFGIIAASYPYYTYPYYYYNPWTVIWLIAMILTYLLFGIMQILWGAAHITTRKHTGYSGLAIATGIMLIIAGAFTMTIFLTFVGWILFFISEIMATVTFLAWRIQQQSTQTP